MDPTPTSTSAAATGPPHAKPRGLFGWPRRLYDWTLSWADTRWGPAALAGLLRWLGPRAKQFIDRNFNILTVSFFVLLILGFWAIRHLF